MRRQKKNVPYSWALNSFSFYSKNCFSSKIQIQKEFSLICEIIHTFNQNKQSVSVLKAIIAGKLERRRGEVSSISKVSNNLLHIFENKTLISLVYLILSSPFSIEESQQVFVDI